MERFAVPMTEPALAAATWHAQGASLFEALPNQGNSSHAAVRVRVGYVTRDALESLLQKVSTLADASSVLTT